MYQIGPISPLYSRFSTAPGPDPSQFWRAGRASFAVSPRRARWRGLYPCHDTTTRTRPTRPGAFVGQRWAFWWACSPEHSVPEWFEWLGDFSARGSDVTGRSRHLLADGLG
jgi:hypothetical protein